MAPTPYRAKVAATKSQKCLDLLLCIKVPTDDETYSVTESSLCALNVPLQD
jgi:hypothetical protein